MNASCNYFEHKFVIGATAMAPGVPGSAAPIFYLYCMTCGFTREAVLTVLHQYEPDSLHFTSKPVEAEAV